MSNSNIFINNHSKINSVNQLKFLYVTGVWSGLSDILFEGHKTARGMPAFVKPLKYFVKAGYKIDLLLLDKHGDRKLNIGPKWLQQIRIIRIPWKNGKVNIPIIFKLYKKIKKLIKENNYHFVYAHGGFIGLVSCYIAHKNGVACGQRLYGTFLAHELDNKPKPIVMLRHPFETLSYKTNFKDFLLVTNDGTRADFVWQVFTRGKTKYRFLHLHNGIDYGVELNTKKTNLKFMEPFLFFPARFDQWKRQDLAIDLLANIHKKGYKNIHLYFSGHINNQSFFDLIFQKAEELGVSKYVHYVGLLSKSEMQIGFRRSIATLSLYDISNLGNVTIEALFSGAILLSRNDGSLEKLISNGENGFLISNMHEGADIIIDLLENESKANYIRQKAIETAKNVFLPWQERCHLEEKIILEAIEKHL